VDFLFLVLKEGERMVQHTRMAVMISGLAIFMWIGCGRENANTTFNSVQNAIGTADAPNPPEPQSPQREQYEMAEEIGFRLAQDEPLSTFSVDVDTASYANARRFLNAGQRPPKEAVRIEEFINYFDYDYAQPTGDHPFAVSVEVAECPWEREHQLVRIGMRGRQIERPEDQASNLVFLLDVSGSMGDYNKLPLVKSAMRLLVNQLHDRDRVAIVVYAGASGLALPSTSVDNKRAILAALDDLRSGGSTNGGEGIQLAYQTAVDHFIPGGVNRVILCTDGDFNVGVTERSDLIDLIETKAKSNVFLSVLGFGVGDLNDATAEQLADHGNGNYSYIDTVKEARKVLVQELGGTLTTIAKDVKIQVDFNPGQVAAYRLIGYDNRRLSAEDFKDDRKDAGEIGAGHRVTAIYQIQPVGAASAAPVDPSKYQPVGAPAEKAAPKTTSKELLEVRVRYKQPQGKKSTEFRTPTLPTEVDFADASTDFRFAAAVAAFGSLLRESKYSGEMSLSQVEQIAKDSQGKDPNGYRREFLQLVQTARELE